VKDGAASLAPGLPAEEGGVPLPREARCYPEALGLAEVRRIAIKLM